MCQGLYPSAFNACDCPSSECIPPSPQPQKCEEQHQQQRQQHVPDLMERMHQGSPQATSLLSKWVSTACEAAGGNPPHPLTLQEMSSSGRLASSEPGGSEGKEQVANPNVLDAAHLVHAFFFDST